MKRSRWLASVVVLLAGACEAPRDGGIDPTVTLAPPAGAVTIQFGDLDQLEGLLEKLR